MLCEGLEVEDRGEKEARDRGDIYTVMTDLHRMAEIRTTYKIIILHYFFFSKIETYA